MTAVLKPISTTDPLTDAVQALIDAKRDEDFARKRRIEAEERIAALANFNKEEGSQTIEAGGVKVTLTARLNYACEDPQALAAACAAAGAPASMIPVKTVVELDATGAKWLRAHEPEYWARVLAPHITVKPAKTSVAVKV
ncbi:hypothetical protein LCC91_07835 [Tepidimonas taiwanensis]|uniref:Uncharacterized protein n=1 Tax=Tepidimonas taiwanensis TaxID=307486 RepID=A0A554XAW6_9BURK|nr:hypothetical protein [Tepidimonas taiwanensis]TSE32980.1 hypothetical protein Ttaiw_00841 [Tepidimonas taiwanensis]UBQ04485.1 hypothetical protein LCC91_07835 [Tepidimonas taiwanensis]